VSDSTLRLLRLELLRGCPLACVHCSAEAGPARTEMMTQKQVHRLLREASELGASEVIFTGGEPLEYPTLLSCASLARSFAMRSTLFTTGITRGAKAPVDRSLLDSSLSVIDSFVFSFYSGRAEVHDRITSIPGSWKNTLDAATHLASRQASIGITFLPLSNNYTDLLGVARLARDLRAYEVRVLRLFKHGRASRASRIESPSRDDFLDVLNEARIDFPNIRVGGAAGMYGEGKPCDAPESEIFVAVDGSASPCPASPTIAADAVSNCFQQGLGQVWRASPVFTRSRQMASEGLDCQRDGCLALRARQVSRLGSRSPTQVVGASPVPSGLR
jgi:MoaA/NifB/PqqE/SkfB family radical SAM enzyme